MEQRETQCGVLILVVGIWISLSGILDLLEKIILPPYNPPPPLIMLGVPTIFSITGILGVLAGLLIYGKNAKGGKLAFIAGVLAVSLTTIQILLYTPAGLLSNPFGFASFVGQTITTFSAPMLLLAAGIKRFRADLGVLIIILGITFALPCFLSFLLDSHLFWHLTMPNRDYMKILYSLSLIIGVIGIIAGLWIRQRLGRGYILAILTGVSSALFATLINLSNFSQVSSFFTGAGLAFFFLWMIPTYQSASLFLVGGILARHYSAKLDDNTGRSDYDERHPVDFY